MSVGTHVYRVRQASAGRNLVRSRTRRPVLRSEKGSTTTYCPWAESLPIRPQGRLVYQDPGLKWWFAYGW